MAYLAPAPAPANSERRRRVGPSRASSFGRRSTVRFVALAITAGIGASLSLAGPQFVDCGDFAPDTQPGALALRGAPDCGGLTLTQSTNTGVIGNGSVVCLEGAVSAETSAARAFVAPSTLTLRCVTFGVRINQGGDWPVDVRILSGDPLAGYDSLYVLREETVVVAANANREFYTVELPDVTLTAGSQFVVELRSRSRRPIDGGDGGQLAFGFNQQGQTAPTFFRGPLCGNEDFVDLASLGFPNLHLVMSVGYDEGASSLLLDGFHHNVMGDAIFTSDGADSLVVEGDPMAGPFGFSVPFGDTTMGVQTTGVEWEAWPGAAMDFDFALASGDVDAFSFVTAPDGSIVVETAFAPAMASVFDVLVFDGGDLVGELLDQASGTVSITQPGVPNVMVPNIYPTCLQLRDPITDTVISTRYVWPMPAEPRFVFSSSTRGVAYAGDRVEFWVRLSDAPGAVASPPTSVDVMATGMASFKPIRDVITRRAGVRFGDASTSPRLVDGELVADVGALVQVTNGDAPIAIFGEATMAPGGPRIRANPLGSSGKDGVRVSFGGVDSASVELDLVNPDPIESFVTLRATQVGGGSGGSVTIDPCLGCPPPIIDDWWNLRPDFAGVGSGTYTLQVVHNEMVVHEESGLSGLAGVSSGRPWKGGKLGGATPCWRMCYPDDTPFIIASTAQQVLMDEVRILAENAGPLEHLDFIEIRAANMDEFGLLNPQTVLPPAAQPCEGDTNGDNIVNFSDLNAVLASFGQGGAGIPGDVNGDGVVDFSDLNEVLASFGNECR